MSEFLMSEQGVRLFIAWTIVRHPIRFVKGYRKLTRC